MKMEVILVVPRYRQTMRPINRIKHVVDIQQALPVNVNLPITIIESKDAPVLANTQEVITGSKVGSFFATVEVVATEDSTGKTPNLYIYFFKNPGGSFVTTVPDGNKVGSDDLKRFVIHQEMVMLQGLTGDGVPRNVFKGVIKIPRGYQRNAPQDKLQMWMFIPSTGVAVNICAQFHYKEFR